MCIFALRGINKLFESFESFLGANDREGPQDDKNHYSFDFQYLNFEQQVKKLSMSPSSESKFCISAGTSIRYTRVHATS